MSIKTNRKILFGTLDKFLEKKEVLGDSDYRHIIILELLVNSLEFAYGQYNKGDISYRSKIEKLEKKLLKLKYECSKICNVKDKIVVTRTNNPPVVENKTVRVLIKEDFTDFPFPEFIGDVIDYDNDEIIKTWFHGYDDDIINLKINNKKPEVKQEVLKQDVYSVKLKSVEDYKYLILNNKEKDCKANLLKVTKEEYKDLLLRGFALRSIKENVLEFQKFGNINTFIELPYENVGTEILARVLFKAKEKAPDVYKSLISDVGVTTFEFYKECDENVSCEGFVKTVEIEPIEDYILEENQLGITSDVGFIKIEEVINNYHDYFELNGIKILSKNLPIVISVDRLLNLKYVSDKTTEEETISSISYSFANKNSINYCTELNTFQVVKRAHLEPENTLVGLQTCCSNHKNATVTLQLVDEGNCCNTLKIKPLLYKIG